MYYRLTNMASTNGLPFSDSLQELFDEEVKFDAPPYIGELIKLSTASGGSFCLGIAINCISGEDTLTLKTRYKTYNFTEVSANVEKFLTFCEEREWLESAYISKIGALVEARASARELATAVYICSSWLKPCDIDRVAKEIEEEFF